MFVYIYIYIVRCYVKVLQTGVPYAPWCWNISGIFGVHNDFGGKCWLIFYGASRSIGGYKWIYDQYDASNWIPRLGSEATAPGDDHSVSEGLLHNGRT